MSNSRRVVALIATSLVCALALAGVRAQPIAALTRNVVLASAGYGAGERGTAAVATTGCACLPTSGEASPPAETAIATITAISAGYAFSLALDSTGTAWAWGDNEYGELGNGSDTTTVCECIPTPAPVRFPAGTTITALSAGYDHSLALDTTGRVWAWGGNKNGELGNGAFSRLTVTDCGCIPTPSPVSFPAGTVITALSAGRRHSLALDSTGRVWAWGGNDSGQLGTGTTADFAPIPTPSAVRLPAGTVITALSAGNANAHSLALDSTGRVWAWGLNGRLGNGSDTTTGCDCLPTPAPVRFSAGTTITTLSVGLDSAGTVWGWGFNVDRQLGTGAATSTGCDCLPTPGPALLPAGTTITALSAGNVHSLALDSTGTVWAWGENSYGELGNGAYVRLTLTDCDCIPTPSPVRLPAGTAITAISAGGSFSLALAQPVAH